MKKPNNHLGFAQAQAKARKRFLKTAMWTAIKVVGGVGFLVLFSAALPPPNKEPFVALRAWIELNRVVLFAAGALIAAIPFLAIFLHAHNDD